MADLTGFLKSDRLYLREVRATDVTSRYYGWMNDPQVTRFLETRFFPNSLETLGDYVASKSRDPQNLFLAIVLQEGDRHIGNIKLAPIDWLHRHAELGLIIGEKDCWGQGYAAEAIQLIVRYAFLGLNLHRVTAGCYEPNQGSLKAFLKAGFEVEGRRREHRYCEGRWVDELALGIVRPEGRS